MCIGAIEAHEGGKFGTMEVHVARGFAKQCTHKVVGSHRKSFVI